MRRRVSYGLLVSLAVLLLLAVDHYFAVAHCFSVLVVVMTTLAWLEFSAMALPGRLGWRRAGATIVAATGIAVWFWNSGFSFWSDRETLARAASLLQAIFVPGLLFGVLLVPTLRWDGRGPTFAEGAVWFTGLVAIAYLPQYILVIRGLEHGEEIALLLLLVVKIGDSGAYFFGKALGRHPFFCVSPKKTIEGAACGLATAIATALIGARVLLPAGFASVLEVAVAACVISAVAQAGDLIESLIKRSFGTKDSASVLPELGGVLDMIDSLLFAGPALYVLLRWHLG